MTIQTWRSQAGKLLELLYSFYNMAEDDGLLLNLFSHSDGSGEVNQGKRDRKLKVEIILHLKFKLEGRNHVNRFDCNAT